jgi:hypothetical protein
MTASSMIGGMAAEAFASKIQTVTCLSLLLCPSDAKLIAFQIAMIVPHVRDLKAGASCVERRHGHHRGVFLC